MSDFTNRLETLSGELRVAFAAACAGRVLRIYELDYDDKDRRPHAAVEVAWRFAMGEEVSPEVIGATKKAAVDATPNIESEGDEYSAPMRACVSAICALDAINDPTAKSANAAASYALEAVESFEDYRGEGSAAEEQWQQRALRLVESWGDKPITREMFAPLDDDPPTWFPWTRG